MRRGRIIPPCKVISTWHIWITASLFPEKVAPSDTEYHDGISSMVKQMRDSQCLDCDLVRVDGRTDALPSAKGHCYIV